MNNLNYFVMKFMKLYAIHNHIKVLLPDVFVKNAKVILLKLRCSILETGGRL